MYINTFGNECNSIPETFGNSLYSLNLLCIGQTGDYYQELISLASVKLPNCPSQYLQR